MFCRKNVMLELNKYRGVVSWKITYGYKNDKEFGDQVVESRLDKSSVYNVLADVLFRQK